MNSKGWGPHGSTVTRDQDTGLSDPHEGSVGALAISGDYQQRCPRSTSWRRSTGTQETSLGGHEEKGTDVITPVPLLCDQCVSKEEQWQPKCKEMDKGQVMPCDHWH
jgi:hypothetical protein